MLLLQAFANTGFSRGVPLWILVCLPSLSVGDMLSPLIACTQISSDSARLACFDREVGVLHEKSAPPAAPAAPPPSPEQKFGLSDAQLRARQGSAPASAPLTDLHAHIVSITVGPADRQLFLLDNGQTWQQIELDPSFFVRSADAVTITRGALGSFWLSATSHRATRVKRLR
jgi:hypothetical protein